MPLMADLPSVVRLRPEFDPDRLQVELLELGGERFRPQATMVAGKVVNQDQFDGWRVLSLRSQGGDPDRGDAGGPSLTDYADTLHLKRTEATRTWCTWATMSSESSAGRRSGP